MILTRGRGSTQVDFGWRIAAPRAQRGLTQIQVAEALGISRRCVCETEAGKFSLSSDRLFRLLALLDVGLVIECKDAA